MTTSELALNAVVLFLVLFRNVGAHPVTLRRFAVPAMVIVVVGIIFLRHPPTAGNDTDFEAVGLAAGLVLGVVAGFLLRLERGGAGQLLTRAGAAFAVLWIAVIAGRVAFSEGATYLYSREVTSRSIANKITGANAFTAMFVLMALAMIAAMMVTLAARTARFGHDPAAHAALAGS